MKTKEKHIHRAICRETTGFFQCVNPRYCNPKAHGGICHVFTCECGWRKYRNSTGKNRFEEGKWEERK